MSSSDDLSKVKESGPLVKCYLQDITVNSGEPVAFDCQIVAHPKPEVMWLKVNYSFIDVIDSQISIKSSCNIDKILL